METTEVSNPDKDMVVYVTKCVDSKIVAVQETTLEEVGIQL